MSTGESLPWDCPSCGRRVPSNIERCRCGFERVSADLPPPPPAERSTIREVPSGGTRVTIPLSTAHVRRIGAGTLVVGLCLAGFWAGRSSRGEDIDPIALWRKAHKSGYDAGYAGGYQAGYAQGWEAMRLKAIEIVASRPSAPIVLPETPVTIQRSPDEEAILRMQRKRLEREECERRYRQMFGANADVRLACW